MARPTVTEVTTRGYEIVESRAFIAEFDQVVDSFGTRSFTLTYTTGLPPTTIELRRAADAPLDLVTVPPGGYVVGDYQILVAASPPIADTIRLTCNITNNGADPASDRWELRGRRSSASLWRFTLSDLTAATTPRFVACDPRAELIAPATIPAGAPATLSLTDATGVGAERTVIGTLPAELAPRYSVSQPGGGVLLAGLPSCTATTGLTITPPDVPQPATVPLTVRTTFGGSCPQNTAFLESTAAPVPLQIIPRAPQPVGLLVTSQSNKTVRRYDRTTGSPLGVAASGGALGDPLGLAIGPDGNLLVSDGQTNNVKRYHGETGAFIDVFASTNLAGPMGMTIHDGSLYVTNSNSPQGVQRFDAVTGVNTGQYVPSLGNPSPRDVKVNPANGLLYVLYYNEGTVEVFDPAGTSHGTLIPRGSGGLFTPSAMAFGPDGHLYISGGTFGGNLGVRRYNASSGAFLGMFANTGDDAYVPIGITFGPDKHLYVSTQSRNNVMRFNFPTGAFMDFFVPDGGGGLTAPFHLMFGLR
jgi:streptogramin lyase